MPTTHTTEYQVFGVYTQIKDDGQAAILSLATDKGPVALGMQRATLERLWEQTKSELERVPIRPH